jgi:hypothetical protein
MFATTTVAILRGTTTDEYGDEQPGGTPVAQGVLASIQEVTRSVFDAATATPRIVRQVVGRVPQGTDVTTTDRIRDERTNTIFAVTAVYAAADLGWPSDIKLDLERTTV